MWRIKNHLRIYSQSQFCKKLIPFFSSLFHKKVIQAYLCQQDHRDSYQKFPVLRLVPEKMHPKEGPYAAPYDGQPDESFLRDAPPVPLGLPLVYAIDEEGQDIDSYEVYFKAGAHRSIFTSSSVKMRVLWAGMSSILAAP